MWEAVTIKAMFENHSLGGKDVKIVGFPFTLRHFRGIHLHLFD
jgi:hypothetical protein